MSTPDFFRSRLDQMIDLRRPLAVLSTRLPWASIEAAIAPKLAHQAKPAKRVIGDDLAGAFDGEFGGGVSPAGRPRLAVRLMVSLLYLKNSFNLSDEELVERWAENVQWQFFGGMDYYEPRLPCDATQIGRFRRLCQRLFRFVGHLPGANAGASIGHCLRAGVPQSSGEETAASAEVVIAAYGAMAFWCRRPLLAWIVKALDDAVDVHQVVPAEAQRPG